MAETANKETVTKTVTQDEYDALMKEYRKLSRAFEKLVNHVANDYARRLVNELLSDTSEEK